MMDFEKRLQQAIKRGEQKRNQQSDEQAKQEMSEEECRNLHSSFRLELSDHIEKCLQKLMDHFPGFRLQTIVGEEGWGAKITRDDLQLRSNQRGNLYSRLEMVVRPYSPTKIVELNAKGTVRNRESFNRSHYQFLHEADLKTLREMVDLWAVDYAEHFASES